MSEITHLLVLRLTESLTEALITDVSSSDLSRANLVQAYRFQDDPINFPIVFSISSGNPDAPELKDGRIGLDTMEDLDLKIPSGEVGGGHLWWRRGRVRVSCNFVNLKYDQELAADVAKTAIGRAMRCIEDTYVSDLIDDFGERAIKVFVPGCHFAEGGGPENQYLWRGMVLWQALTERP